MAGTVPAHPARFGLRAVLLPNGCVHIAGIPRRSLRPRFTNRPCHHGGRRRVVHSHRRHDLRGGRGPEDRSFRLPTPNWWAPLAPYLDFNITVSIAIVSLLTIVYTALGGLKAVVVTESFRPYCSCWGRRRSRDSDCTSWPSRTPARCGICIESACVSRREGRRRAEPSPGTRDVFATLDSRVAGERRDERRGPPADQEDRRSAGRPTPPAPSSKASPRAEGIPRPPGSSPRVSPTGIPHRWTSSSRGFHDHVDSLRAAAAASGTTRSRWRPTPVRRPPFHPPDHGPHQWRLHLVGHAAGLPDPGHLVLVCRSDDRSARPGGSERAGCPARPDLRRLHQGLCRCS